MVWVPYKVDQRSDSNEGILRIPQGSLVETKSLTKGPKSAISSFSRATLRTEVQDRPRGIRRGRALE